MGWLGDVDRDSQVGGDLGEADTDVALGAEPELMAVGESSGQCFAYEQTASLIPGADGRRLVEQRPGIEDLQDLRVRTADRLLVRVAQ